MPGLRRSASIDQCPLAGLGERHGQVDADGRLAVARLGAGNQDAIADVGAERECRAERAESFGLDGGRPHVRVDRREPHAVDRLQLADHRQHRHGKLSRHLFRRREAIVEHVLHVDDQHRR